MDLSGPVRDPQAGKNFRVGRFRLHGVAYLVKDARMGIDPGRRHPGMGGKNVPRIRLQERESPWARRRDSMSDRR